MVLAPLLMGQAGPRLVPDISARSIEIRYSFTGAQLLLFGAILYPGGRTPTRSLDVVVVLKGPVQPMIVREKQKIAGIWMNADSHRFVSAPSYYAVASNRPLSQIVGERTAAVYELGLGNLQLSPGGGAQPEKAQRFENSNGVEISDGVLYRARIAIPSQVPIGTYETETFLIDRGKVIAAATKEVEVRKTGFERFIATAARRHGFLYGLAAVVLSLGLGWGAAALFGRNS
jgi:uncharacterized protein (TIGR02186 family)